MRWLRPFSSTITSQPAAVRTSATVEPPGPDPTMTASQSRSAIDRRLAALLDLGVGVAAGLDVADEVDGLPSRAVAVAAVHGVAVHAFAGVDVQQVLEPIGRGREATVLRLGFDVREVGADGRDSHSVSLLPADDR